jgi:hypothetical protein
MVAGLHGDACYGELGVEQCGDVRPVKIVYVLSRMLRTTLPLPRSIPVGSGRSGPRRAGDPLLDVRHTAR